MRLDEMFLPEEGRIVKGVNTTCDVGPNEIAIQSSKFRLGVTKNGIPIRVFNKTHPRDMLVSEATLQTEALDITTLHDTATHILALIKQGWTVSDAVHDVMQGLKGNFPKMKDLITVLRGMGVMVSKRN
jgi:hypothetical protein